MALAEAIRHLEKAKGDNERIAALLLVVKLVRSGELTKEERRSLFDCVGFSFINRLLNTSSIPEGCSVSPSHSLALALLACFATDLELATHPQVISKIPLLLSFISGDPTNNADELALQEDSLHILLALTSSPLGLHSLLNNHCALETALALINGGPHKAKTKYLLLCVLGQPPIVQRHRAVADEVMCILGKEFNSSQELTKFELLDVLCSILAAVGEVLLEPDSTWLSDMAAGLKDILSSRITVSQRQRALQMSAQLVAVLGVQWTISSGNCNFFKLLTNLASVEVQLLMSGEGGGEGEVWSHSLLLSSLFLLLENSIMFSAQQAILPSSKRVLSPEDLLQVHVALTEAFVPITSLLSNLPPPSSSSYPSPSSLHYPLLLASVRVLGAWLAEEGLDLTFDLSPLLMNLVCICNQHLMYCLRSIGGGGEGKLEGNGAEGEAKEEGEGPSLFDNPLKFLLPGLSHLVALDGPRAVVLQAGGHQLLLSFMTALSGGGTKQISPEAQSLFSLSCEVLLSVCVCEPHLRSDHVLTHTALLLSTHLITGITDIRLGLQASLLWLMVARQQGDKEMISQYSPSSLTSLWTRMADLLTTALKLSPSSSSSSSSPSSSSSLTVPTSEDWDTIEELWQLMMRELTVMAASRDEAREYLRSSHFLENISTVCKNRTEEGSAERATLEKLLQTIR